MTGYVAHTAENKKKVLTDKPDLIVGDSMMPVLDGCDVSAFALLENKEYIDSAVTLDDANWCISKKLISSSYSWLIPL